MPRKIDPKGYHHGQPEPVTISAGVDLSPYNIDSVEYEERTTHGKNHWVHTTLVVDPHDQTKGTTRLTPKKVKKGPSRTRGSEDGVLTINMSGGASPLVVSDTVTVKS